MKPTDLKCFDDVAKVIGHAAALYELSRVCGAGLILKQDDDLNGVFIWGGTPQGSDYWLDIQNKIQNLDKDDSESRVLNEKNLAAETLKSALAHMDDRAKTYDSPCGERSMEKCVSMFNTMYGLELTEEQGWAFMCLLKLVRTSQGDFRADNYEDLAAYAGLMREGAQPRD